MKRNETSARTPKLKLSKLTIARLNQITGGRRWGTSDWTNCVSNCGTCDTECTDCC
jgi:hypothetical protein